MVLIAKQRSLTIPGKGPHGPELDKLHRTQTNKTRIRRAAMTAPVTHERQIKVVVAAAARGVITEDDFRAAGVKPPFGQARETVFALAALADPRVLSLGVGE